MKKIAFKPLISLLALAALVACKEAPPPPAAEAQPILQGKQLRYPAGHSQLGLLKTTPVKPATAVPVELPAHLVWNEEKTQRLYAPLAGRVTGIHADLGQSVAAGTPLLSLHSPDLGAAQADAAKARVDQHLADKALRRQRELFDAGIIARKEFEQSEADAARAGAEAERANARTRLYGGGELVNQQLVLKSGIRGVVVERNVNPGQELRPDLSGPGVPALFVVSDPSRLWVQIDAREADIAALRPGASFELDIPTLPGHTFKGRVTAASDFIDPNTRTIKIRGEVDNGERLLKAEMLGTAHIARKMGEGFIVPAGAVFLRGAQHWVFVEAGPGTFEPREVELGHEGAQESLVTAGLAASDVVVSQNGLLLARVFRIAEDAARPAEGAKDGTK